MRNRRQKDRLRHYACITIRSLSVSPSPSVLLSPSRPLSHPCILHCCLLYSLPTALHPFLYGIPLPLARGYCFRGCTPIDPLFRGTLIVVRRASITRTPRARYYYSHVRSIQGRSPEPRVESIVRYAAPSTDSGLILNSGHSLEHT